MSYESLERELERRQERRTKGDKKSKRKSFPYRRGGRKGSKVRTKLNSENWSGDEESPLAKALAAARERANIVKPQLNIKKLPHRNQKSLTDFEANTRWTSSYPGELPPWCSNRNPRAIVQYPCNCGECDAEYFEAQEYGTNMSLSTNQLKILKYLGQFHPNLIDNWDPPAGLTQSEIAKAVGQKSHTGVINPLNRLIEMGLVVSRQKRPPGARRVVKVFFPTWEGHELVRNLEQSTQSVAEPKHPGWFWNVQSNQWSQDSSSFEAHNIDIEYWETQAHENTLTGLSHEDIHSSEEFRAKGISHLKPSQIKEKATEILVEFQKHNLKGMWLQELTNRINATLPRTRNVTQSYVSKSLGKSIGGRSPFYITSDGRVFNHRGQDRGEFIKGVI
jgi:DNA-binding MarR family transcriptional regulator